MENIFKEVEETKIKDENVPEIKQFKIPQINFDDLEVESTLIGEEENNPIALQKVSIEQDEDIDSEKLKKFSKNGVVKVEFHKKLVYIEKELYDELTDLSVYDNKSINSIIIDGLKAYTKKRKKVIVEIRKIKEEE